jgi:hypothetical protein
VGGVGSHNTRANPYGSVPDCHAAHMTRVNHRLVDDIYEAYPICHVSKIDTCTHMIGQCVTRCLAEW